MSKNRKKVLIFVDHDIMIRHFLMNGVLVELEKFFQVSYVFPGKSKRVKMNPESLSLSDIRIIDISNERSFLWRRLYHAKTMRTFWFSEDGMVRFKFWLITLGRSAFIRSFIASMPGFFYVYRIYMLFKIGKARELNRLIEEERPDLILHPTVLEGPFVSDLIRLGNKYGVPTVYIMNSWDNPSTKCMTIGKPSHLVVWGEQTKQHAKKHMGMHLKDVSSLGAAQFLLYQKPPKVEREKFRKSENIPLDKKVLLYAGSSKGLNEVAHLKQLEYAIDSGIIEDCKVLYRPHPWKAPHPDEDSFFNQEWKHTQLAKKSIDYYTRILNKTSGISTPPYEDTYNILNAVDCVVSPLSTILLESVMLGKPILAYLPDEDMKNNNMLQTVARLHQFDEFFEKITCITTNNPEDFVNDCGRLLSQAGDLEFCDSLKKETEFFVVKKDYIAELSRLINTLTA